MIPAWAAPYIGIPYRDRGRTREGLDCWGLCAVVLAEVFAIRVPSYVARYPSAKDDKTVAQLFFEEATSTRWQRVEKDTAKAPDVLTTWVVDKDGRHRHVGLFVTPERFLHVLAGRETCIERVRPHWYPRIDGVYRHEALVVA